MIVTAAQNISGVSDPVTLTASGRLVDAAAHRGDDCGVATLQPRAGQFYGL